MEIGPVNPEISWSAVADNNHPLHMKWLYCMHYNCKSLWLVMYCKNLCCIMTLSNTYSALNSRCFAWHPYGEQ